MPQPPKPPPELPPLDPEALAEAARRVMQKKKPATGWPGTPPKDVRPAGKP